MSFGTEFSDTKVGPSNLYGDAVFLLGISSTLDGEPHFSVPSVPSLSDCSLIAVSKRCGKKTYLSNQSTSICCKQVMDFKRNELPGRKRCSLFDDK